SVPSAIADVVGGFIGVDDFIPSPPKHIENTPDFTSGRSHYLAPGDFATIYNTEPLAQAGYDGTGQSIAIVGQSDILIGDIRAFRTDFGLPPNDPKLVLVGADPGFSTDSQFEANLDLEWSGAVAPKAAINYVYSADVFTALAGAVSLNLSPVISSSFGACEADAPPSLRSIAQQANAQGITIVSASGDTGNAGCDLQNDLSFGTHGVQVQFPASLPEVTGVGGTMFDEGSGAYWNRSNSSTGGSALSYIPETAWNETSVSFGLAASTGGASALYPKPAWQAGPGVAQDGMRDVPDLSLAAAAAHDPYLVTFHGNSLYAVGGTSASTPSFAGILALLNQYAVKQGLQKSAGLGNINAQIYRMARSAPAAFHDIVSGNNIVPCLQGSPGCANGSFGYDAGPGYDQVTGLGSIDANVFVTSWGQAVNPVTLTVTSSAAKVTLNDTVTLTAKVTPVSGTGTPTGSVTFTGRGQLLGTAPLTGANGQQTASLTFPAWTIGAGTATIGVAYSGDAAFGAAGGTIRIQSTLPATPGVAAVTASVSNPVFAFQVGSQPLTWQAFMTLQELAGVPAQITSFAIDGAAQPVDQSFPSPNLPAKGSLSGTIVLRDLTVPAVKTFTFAGVDAGGNNWTREVQAEFRGPFTRTLNFTLWSTPLTVQQNTGAQLNCPWPQQVIIDESGGYEMHLRYVQQGSTDISNRIPAIFGTSRLAPYGSMQGTLCWTGVNAPGTDSVLIEMEDDYGDAAFDTLRVNFAGPSNSGAQLSASPAQVTLKQASIPIFQAPATLNVNLSDKTQPWSATVYPVSHATSWLRLSQYSGTGPATLTVSASGAGFEPGVYRATIVIQSPNAIPQYVNVPVMFVNAPPSSTSISSVANALSLAPGASPGMMLSVFGTQLANAEQGAAGLPLSNSLGGVSATVNGWPAPLYSVSPTRIDIQAPYETPAGTAVLGINNNGQVAGFLFDVQPASPGIYSSGGSVSPAVTASRGGYATIYVTGTGDISQSVPDGVPVPNGTPVADLPAPLLPVNVTVGGVPALVQFAGTTPGVVGLTQINFVVPMAVAPGTEPVVVNVGGYPSVAANITVQ
ncbi:MAG: Ig-like domain repeat protein, partial [Acidobacteriota bacterium]|nr:Ig-like domain repeat protein [Acidobacteriota bacterium]